MRTGPVSFSDRIEASNFLTARIIFDKTDVAGNLDFALFFGNLLFFIGDWLRTEATAVASDILSIPEEGWVSMKVDLAVFVLIPLGIQKQIFGVEQLLNLSCVEASAIGDCLSRS